MTQRILLILLVLAFVTIAYFVGNLGAPVQVIRAAPADPAIPDCVAIGKSGPLVVSRCEDEENGQVIYANNYGMMVVAP